MTTSDSEQLLDLLSRKLNLLEEILACSKEQSEVTYQENPLKYDNLIESRAKCLEELKKLEVVLKRSLFQLNISSVNEGYFQGKLTALNTNITMALKKILELDKENHVRILKEQSDLKNKMQNVRQGRKGIAGYTGNNLSGAGIFTDNKR